MGVFKRGNVLWSRFHDGVEVAGRGALAFGRF
jgi:hypothetical protein